jgi:hypothetical protein
MVGPHETAATPAADRDPSARAARHPAEGYARGFIGEAALNLFTQRLRARVAWARARWPHRRGSCRPDLLHLLRAGLRATPFPGTVEDDAVESSRFGKCTDMTGLPGLRLGPCSNRARDRDRVFRRRTDGRLRRASTSAMPHRSPVPPVSQTNAATRRCWPDIARDVIETPDG